MFIAILFLSIWGLTLLLTSSSSSDLLPSGSILVFYLYFFYPYTHLASNLLCQTCQACLSTICNALTVTLLPNQGSFHIPQSPSRNLLAPALLLLMTAPLFIAQNWRPVKMQVFNTFRASTLGHSYLIVQPNTRYPEQLPTVPPGLFRRSKITLNSFFNNSKRISRQAYCTSPNRLTFKYQFLHQFPTPLPRNYILTHNRHLTCPTFTQKRQLNRCQFLHRILISQSYSPTNQKMIHHSPYHHQP